eukprot:TRINITY_DN955_c2_g1_i1.p1 TRINITY_DN955_c2_g1~~TRINITY_DN955_c2_g1_i1.p1  ORF type:complete len:302 (+),score=36.01 TRINITY_DN955_c2_g1_i1:108-1013(+)
MSLTRNEFISGSLASLSVIFVQPFDVVKTRMEAKNNSQFRYFFHSFKNILKNEGMKGLFKGTSPTLIYAVPSGTLFFGFSNYLRKKLKEKEKLKNYPIMINLYSGAIARCISTTVCSPIILIKTRFESVEKERIYNFGKNNSKQHFQVIRAVFQTIKNEGIRGLYVGLTATLLRDIPWASLQFTFYQQIKEIMINQSIISNSNHHTNINNNNSNNSIINFLSGAIAGLIASILTHPFDVIKTNQQLYQNNSLINTANIIYKTNNSSFFSFFKGLQARCIHRMFLPAIAWTIYEKSSIYLNN